MWSKIQHATATGKRVVVEPRLVRPIAVMKLRINGEYFPERTTLHDPVDGLHCRYRTIRQVNSQQAVCIASCLDYSSRFKSIPSERLLTEHRYSLLERSDRLLRVKSIRRGNHNPVEIVTQQFLERREENCP